MLLGTTIGIVLTLWFAASLTLCLYAIYAEATGKVKINN